jgi:hypothetical protein
MECPCPPADNPDKPPLCAAHEAAMAALIPPERRKAFELRVQELVEQEKAVLDKLKDR